jgi:cytochrome c2
MMPRFLIPITTVLGLLACSDEQPTSLRIADGDAEQGYNLIHAYGCGTCHMIEGIRGARGKVGPSLHDYGQQHLLAGFLPNTPQHLVAWLIDPVALKPDTGMPAQGLSEADARHIATYLYSLGGTDREVYPPDPPLPLRGPEEMLTTLDVPHDVSSETMPRTRRIVPQSGNFEPTN